MKDLYASPAALPSQLKNGARCLQGLLARMALLLALGGLLLQQAQAAVPPRLEQPVRSAESDSLEAVLARLRVQHLLALEGRQYGQDRDRERREWLSAYRAYTLERDALIEAHYARQGKETKQQQSSDGSLSLQSVSGFDLVPDSVELRALRDLYSSTGGEGWTHSTNWLTGTTSADFDTWYGVTVTNGDVTAIILSRNALGDTIPSSLGELSMLSYLHLNGNRLSGPVPECLRSLPELQNLYLGQNSFSGPLPLWLGQLSKLQVLSLHDNALTGGIPESLGNLAALTSLNLDGNRLSGGIPAALGRLTNLLSLYLSFNSLTGPIPDSLANLTRLQHLDFYRNDLGGEVPDWLGDFSDLETLKLRSCGLSGPIPASLGNLSKLYYLSLRGNGLTGGIPESLGNLASMRNLYLSDNSLSGPVPGSLAALAVLENLDLFTNKLEGGLPDFSASPNRSSLNLRVQGNRLGFGVIEPNMTGAGTSAIGTFTYSPQDDIPAPDTLGFTAGQPLELRAVTGGTRNLYQWQR
ncbi:Leucine Rich Repeat (LRR) protein, partial [Pontibacter ummariensis]